MTTLYIVSTPIGNLEDITLRALRILNEVDCIAAENALSTRILLKHHGIKTKVISYRESNKNVRIPQIINMLHTKTVAIVSDAGTPLVSDPGLELVRAAIHNSIDIVSIPGPSAITASLTSSGISITPFLFVGFLPRQKSKRRIALQNIHFLQYTLVIFEAPHRLTKTLEDMLDILGNRNISISRELTKIHEEIFRDSISNAISFFSNPRGEFTIVVEPSSTKPSLPNDSDVSDLLQILRDEGLRAREAVNEVVKTHGGSRKEIYKMWHQLPKNTM